MDKSAKDNRANQLNPQNEKYWQARGVPGKPGENVVPPGAVPPETATVPNTSSEKK